VTINYPDFKTVFLYFVDRASCNDSCAGRKCTSDLDTTQPPTQSNSYQRLYWHNLSLLMMSTMCSKHVES